MTTATALYRCGCSLLLGGFLGILFGFFRPLGRRHRNLADLLFSLGAVWIWLWVCFAVCRGDVRTVYLAVMLLGCLLWEKTFGFWLRPVFSGFWRILERFTGLLLLPWKKILDFTKILFASAEKWVTIRCNNLQSVRRKESHGKEKHPAKDCESGSSSRIQYP